MGELNAKGLACMATTIKSTESQEKGTLFLQLAWAKDIRAHWRQMVLFIARGPMANSLLDKLNILE